MIDSMIFSINLSILLKIFSYVIYFLWEGITNLLILLLIIQTLCAHFDTFFFVTFVTLCEYNLPISNFRIDSKIMGSTERLKCVNIEKLIP